MRCTTHHAACACREAEYAARFKAAVDAAKSFRDLNVCYRLGKRPSENLFARLKKARAFMQKLGDENA